MNKIYAKTVSVVISFILLMSALAPVHSFASEAEPDAKAAEVLITLGIVDIPLGAEFVPDEEFTKREFAKALLNAIGMNGAGYDGSQTFYDIPADDKDFGVLMLSAQLGIISGGGDGYANPDSAITVTQALKMAACAMGYAPLAQQLGAYPVGYVKAASDYLDYRAADYDAVLTKGMGAELLFELLDAPVMEIASIENSTPVYNYGSKSSVTLLELGGFERYAGIVTATPFETTVKGEDFAPDGAVTVSGRSFNINDEALYALFGCEVEVYYTHRKQNDALCIVPCDGTEITEIKTEFINENKTDSDAIVYDEGTEEIKLKLYDPVMIYNGEGVIFDEELMFAGSGLVKVIKNDISGLCTVIVRDAVNVIAAGVDYEDRVYFKSPLPDGTRSVSDNDGKLVVTNSDGDIIAPSEIEPGNVLSVEISKSKSVARITVCDEKLEAKPEKRDDKLLIDGAEYTSICDISEIDVGNSYTFYLNYLGQICRIEPETNMEKYGYLLDAAARNTLGSKLILRIFRTNGSVTEYECASKLKFNGKTVDTADKASVKAVVDSLASTAITQVSGEKYQQLIKFTSNSDGLVNSICTSASDGSSDSLKLSFGYEKRKYRKETESFGDFFVGQDTVIFNIPSKTNKQLAENMSVTSGFRFANDDTYSTVVYDCDTLFVAKAIVNFTGAAQGEISIDSHVAVFDRVTGIIDENGEKAYNLYVYESGNEKSYVVYEDSGIDLPQYSKGDLLKLLVSEGECTAIETDLDITSESVPPEDFQEKSGSYSSASYTTGVAHMAQMRKVFGSIALCEDDRIVVEAQTADGTARVLAKVSGFGAVTVCDFAEDDIYTVSTGALGAYAKEVNPNARAFVHMRYGAPMSLVVYVFEQ